ncbi:endolytic transglycosylase MltG [Carnobacterium inhibens]|uniref:Endolytic murein transglycosylase n=2 Tax=Carnobacterium inhibens TaxID=147709 RepID=U5SBH4_9LACT|nr:endolytic transglycosylase MltG [Carnobacterium inhibens]AGY81458.1 aminodeoxychorismate lyase [Carnobacterium inhibens subsp. gilichinskyi]MBC9825030.1 endolytic transglycosylase MltG [Carnobacterium inhibens]
MSKRNDNNQIQNHKEVKIQPTDKVTERQKEKKLVKRIVLSITAAFIILVVLFGLIGYQYVTTSLEPLDKNDQTEKIIEIPTGSSSKDIAQILQNNNIIKSAIVFSYYVRMNNETGFQAGNYEFSPSMSLDTIISQLQEGGTAAEYKGNKVLVKEGITIDQIADAIAATTDYSKEDFLTVIKDEAFLTKMKTNYPELLTSALEAEDTRYRLEGYLFPATYDFPEEMSLEELVENMISKMDEVMQEYYPKIKESNRNVHDVLTIASLVEREGFTLEDRKLIAGVFNNRLEINMPLQTDIAVLYALDEHKEYVSNNDVAVESPYNLYVHPGFGPGPVDSPSADAIKATLEPTESEYLYFLADMSTGKIYYAETYQQHLEYKAEYVD